MEINIAAVFSTLNHWYIILGTNTSNEIPEGVKYGPFKGIVYPKMKIHSSTHLYANGGVGEVHKTLLKSQG